MLMVWLLTCLSLTLERLYRLRYLHRGSHPVRTAIDLWRVLVLGLSVPVATDSGRDWRQPSAIPSEFFHAACGGSPGRLDSAKFTPRK